MTEVAPPGWYPDDKGEQRYWDGSQWTIRESEYADVVGPDTGSQASSAPPSPSATATGETSKKRENLARRHRKRDRPAVKDQTKAEMPTMLEGLLAAVGVRTVSKLEREFHAPPAAVLPALEVAVKDLERFHSTDKGSCEIVFDTKFNFSSVVGSRWSIQVHPFGTGSVALATYWGDGGLSVRSGESPRIQKIFDRVEQQLEPLAASSSAVVPEIEISPLVPADLAPKHLPLVAGILEALGHAEVSARTGDILGEESAILIARRRAAEAGALTFGPSKWCEKEIQARVVGGRLRTGVELIGRVGANLVIMSDRIFQGETVYIFDDRVSARVEVDGQAMTTTRPTLTRMALGSVLPGSALLVGLAVPKEKAHDWRMASFILTHPEWSLVEPIDPDAAHEVVGLAGQINALVDQRRVAEPNLRPGDGSVADELAKLAALRDGGVLTDEEFAAAKSRLLE
jgi:hypothetical protein